MAKRPDQQPLRRAGHTSRAARHRAGLPHRISRPHARQQRWHRQQDPRRHRQRLRDRPERTERSTQSRVHATGTGHGALATTHRWTYVTNIASAFNTHGYGDWFRTATDSVILQGPLGNRNFITDEKTRTTGTLHPIGGGLLAQRDRLDAMFSQADLVTDSFTLGSDAFLSNASNGYTMVVRNRSFRTASPATTARIYLSADSTIDDSDLGVAFVNVPALGPGQSITLTGLLPAMSDPYRTFFNLALVAPFWTTTTPSRKAMS
ncbi:MAG: hypothetical protein QM770_19240 [Tepidisphaeraceae bacterium]